MEFKITAVSEGADTHLCTISVEGTKSTLSHIRTNDEAIDALPECQQRALIGLAAFWLLENTEIPEDMSLLRAAAYFYRTAASHIGLDMDRLTQATMIRHFLDNGLPRGQVGPNISTCGGANGKPVDGILTGIERAKALKSGRQA